MDTQPCPPWPACACSTTRSTKATATEAPPVPPASGAQPQATAGRGDRPDPPLADVCRLRSVLRGGNAHDLAAAPGAERDRSRGQGEQRVIGTATDQVAGVELGAPLPDDDLA